MKLLLYNKSILFCPLGKPVTLRSETGEKTNVGHLQFLQKRTEWTWLLEKFWSRNSEKGGRTWEGGKEINQVTFSRKNY